MRGREDRAEEKREPRKRENKGGEETLKGEEKREQDRGRGEGDPRV